MLVILSIASVLRAAHSFASFRSSNQSLSRIPDVPSFAAHMKALAEVEDEQDLKKHRNLDVRIR
jgi:hypothetical protein